MTKILKFICLLLVVVICFSFISCTDTEERYEITDTFSKFKSNDNYIFQTLYELHLGKNVIPNSELTYNGFECEFLYSTDFCAYGYCKNDIETTVYIVSIDYDSLDISLCDTVELPSDLIHGSFYDNSFYFRTNDPTTDEFQQMYTIYDMSNKEISTCDTDDFIDVVERRDIHGDYEFEYPDLPLIGNLKVRITNTKTNETKRFSSKKLKGCEEGKKILKLPHKQTNLGVIPSDVYVDGDDIYFLCLQSIGFLGNPSYYFIVKYNFNTESIEYCSTIYFKTYPENTSFFYIPSTENSTLN